MARGIRIGFNQGPLTLQCSSGKYGIMSPDVGLTSPGAASLAASTGSYIFSGQPITLTGTGAPNAPTQFLLVQQGGTSNGTSPVTNSQKHTWAAPVGGASVSGYRLYQSKNGSAFVQIGGDLPNTTFSYTDTSCTNSNDPNYQAFLDSYAYKLTAFNAAGESHGVTPACYLYQGSSGGSNCSNGSFSFGIPPASEVWNATMNGRTCYQFNFNGGGGQPISQQPLAGGFDLVVGLGYTSFVCDVNPGSTGLNQNISFSQHAARTPAGAGGDAFGWLSPVEINDGSTTYGPVPVANTWATYTIPLVKLGWGSGTFNGSITGGVLTVTSLGTCPNIIGAGGRITGPGIPANTILTSQNQSNSIGTFQCYGPGITGTTNVAAGTYQYQNFNAYKLGFIRTGGAGATTVGYDNFGFV